MKLIEYKTNSGNILFSKTEGEMLEILIDNELNTGGKMFYIGEFYFDYGTYQDHFNVIINRKGYQRYVKYDIYFETIEINGNKIPYFIVDNLLSHKWDYWGISREDINQYERKEKLKRILNDE